MRFALAVALTSSSPRMLRLRLRSVPHQVCEPISHRLSFFLVAKFRHRAAIKAGRPAQPLARAIILTVLRRKRLTLVAGRPCRLAALECLDEFHMLGVIVRHVAIHEPAQLVADRVDASLFRLGALLVEVA